MGSFRINSCRGLADMGNFGICSAITFMMHRVPPCSSIRFLLPSGHANFGFCRLDARLRSLSPKNGPGRGEIPVSASLFCGSVFSARPRGLEFSECLEVYRGSLGELTLSPGRKYTVFACYEVLPRMLGARNSPLFFDVQGNKSVFNNLY